MFSELAPAPLPAPPMSGVCEKATAAETTVESIVELRLAMSFRSPAVMILEFLT